MAAIAVGLEAIETATRLQGVLIMRRSRDTKADHSRLSRMPVRGLIASGDVGTRGATEAEMGNG